MKLMMMMKTTMKHINHQFDHSLKRNGSSRRFPKLVGRMVGRDYDRQEILWMLRFGQSNLKLISIVGMVGIGKTTLAKCVYGDPDVVKDFNQCSWITVPQECNKRQILGLLLRSISPSSENKIGNEGATDEELVVEVCRQLSGKSVFSRNKECMTHKLEKIRCDIVETCDGLLWSIVVVAKSLSKYRNILKGWEKIKKETETLGILDRNALIHDYNKLPQHLKVCFLYFGVFPKRKEVLVKMLIRLWIAEGFVNLEPLVYPELETQAYAYVEELFARSLVLISSEDSDDKIKSCRMHSALHSFCVGEAQKEGIFCVVNTLQHSRLPLGEFANSCRWLSLYTHSFDYYVLLRVWRI
ncbi:PREDICTED: putative late blight resistance protein homolog R1B-17 [Ipomoea nil]|uniref:putative late blight resistance protein homolog R1B-17 n=1 Tax=Ipomoea nil TaxID=35883 RepID=UPI000901F1CD|nr:PREDICTED: putative late blight resistance protein homolog R1B-17 [Ipomoea nil]